MTVLKIKNRPEAFHFNNFVNDFFKPFPSNIKDDGNSGFRHAVPCNIRESETAYLVDVVAPGLNKEDFNISLDNNMVTVSFEKKSENEQKSEKIVRNEYQTRSFSRSFSIDETVNVDQISAQYVNGILTLNFPKKEVVKQTKQISVA